MVSLLIKKQMTEIFRGYFYDARKNKARSKFATVLFLLLYIGIMVGVLGGMFTYLSIQLCKPFVQAGMGWMYFWLMSLIAIALGAFGSIFNTFSGLYLSKDNDLLLALPIPVRSILFARLASVYLLGLMYSAVVIVPAVIVYFLEAKITPAVVLGSIALILSISFIILFLSCLLGWCVAKISVKLKNKSFVTVFVSLAFIAAYYFVYYKAQLLIQRLVANVAVYGEKVQDASALLYRFGKMGEGDGIAILGYLAGTFLICVLTFVVLERSFIGIVTSTGKTERVVYKEKRVKEKSVKSALLGKEFARFTASPNYMLNCGLGCLALPILGVVFLIKGEDILQKWNQVFAVNGRTDIVLVFVAAMLCLVISMNDMVVPSVSLEGKNLWIAQSLPVAPWEILCAKLKVQLITTGIPLILCDICVACVLDCSMAKIVMILLVSFAFMVFLALLGLFLGINMVNLTWTNELAPIKQSLSVLISMFGGWAVSIATGALYAGTGYKLGMISYLAIVTIVFALLSGLLFGWLKKKGTAKFAQL